jgi:hypothetical protein
MIFPNAFDGYKNHPENEFIAEDFTGAEHFLLQEMSDTLRNFLDAESEEPIGIKYRARAFKDTMVVKFYIYYNYSKRYGRKFLAVLDRKTWAWTTDEPDIQLNELFRNSTAKDYEDIM